MSCVRSQVASGPAPLGFAKMRYEPTPKAGVAPAREIAKVRRHTLFGGSAVSEQCLDEGCKCMRAPALSYICSTSYLSWCSTFLMWSCLHATVTRLNIYRQQQRKPKTCSFYRSHQVASQPVN